MLREFIESVRTPTSTEARKLGYLYESIALMERHRRRRKDWLPHLENCHKTILNFATGGRSLVVLGSGPLLDIPLPDLLKRYEKIALVDLVHPRQVRNKWGQHKQILFVDQDITGTARQILNWKGGELPIPRPPDLSEFQPDFILSANCLSQLPLKPRIHLAAHVPAPQLDEFSERLSLSHLNHIKSLGVEHLIITDFETRIVSKDGSITEKSVPFFDSNKMKLLQSWTWKIAPRGELLKDQSVEMSVGSFTVL